MTPKAFARYQARIREARKVRIHEARAKLDLTMAAAARPPASLPPPALPRPVVAKVAKAKPKPAAPPPLDLGPPASPPRPPPAKAVTAPPVVDQLQLEPPPRPRLPPLPPVPPPVSLAAPSHWQKQCRARSAETGKQCGLLVPHDGPHRHGAIEFRRALVGEEQPTRSVDTAAWSHPASAMDGVA